MKQMHLRPSLLLLFLQRCRLHSSLVDGFLQPVLNHHHHRHHQLSISSSKRKWLSHLPAPPTWFSTDKTSLAFSSPSSPSSSSSSSSLSLGEPICEYHQVDIPTSQQGPPTQSVSVEDLNPTIQKLLAASGMTQGVVHVLSRHTTTAIAINEREVRLADDMKATFLSLIPPDVRSLASSSQQEGNAAAATTTKATTPTYRHNDIDQRPDSQEEADRCRENGWNVDDPAVLQKWRDQEPINAHSHLLAMLLGSSESIPVVNGSMMMGQWQSVLLVDLDGPRDRTVGIQFMGYK